MPKPYDNRREKLAYFLLILYAAVVFMFDASETNIRFIYATYGLLCLDLVYVLRTVRLCSEVKILIGYLFFGLLSIIWSENASTSFLRVRGVFLLIVFLILMTTYVGRNKKPIALVHAAIIGSLALSVYMFVLYGVSGVLGALQQTQSRIGGLINNVNAVANSLVVGMVALIGVVVFYKKRVLLLLLIPIGVCMLAAGSRTAAISLLFGILVILFLVMRNGRNPSQTLFRVIGILIAVLIVWLIIRSIPATRELVLRLENALAVFTGGQTVYKETSAQSRMDFIEQGWKQFLKTPIFGNGIGCAGYALVEEYNKVTYLHNNYIEILASGGIVGFVLYYTPYLMVLHKLRIRIFRQHDKDPVVSIAFALLLTKLVGHLGTVMYYSKIEFIMLALWISIANIPIQTYEQTE